MKVLAERISDWAPAGSSSVTVGVFDGVHRGHRALISRLDDDLVKTVLTFEPHPVEVLRPGTPPRLITTVEERLALLEGVGVSQVGILDLRVIRDLEPRDFVEQILLARLDMRHLALGPDFRFGKDRSGDVALLEDLARRHGFEVETVGLVSDGDGPVSSSRVRRLIESGRVARAAEELSTRFRITGPVIHGDKRGAAIGFPTANLEPPPRKVVPATGIYAAFAHIRGRVERAAVNVGHRPTFGGGELLVEAYIIDFDGEIYGEELTIEFVEYLRAEVDFPGVGDLVEQMRRDVERSMALLESTVSNVG